MSLTARDHEIWDNLYNIDGTEFAKYCTIVTDLMQDGSRFKRSFPAERHIQFNRSYEDKSDQIIAIDDRILDGRMVFLSTDDNGDDGDLPKCECTVQKRKDIPFFSFAEYNSYSDLLQIYDTEVPGPQEFNICVPGDEEAYWFQQSTVMSDVELFAAQFMYECKKQKNRSFMVFYHPALVFIRNNYDTMRMLYEEKYGS